MWRVRVNSHLCLVLTAPALECIGLEVCYGDESTEVADVYTVGIRSCVEPFVQELGCPVGDLTVTLHLPETKTTIADGVCV